MTKWNKRNQPTCCETCTQYLGEKRCTHIGVVTPENIKGCGRRGLRDFRDLRPNYYLPIGEGCFKVPRSNGRS